MQLHLPFSVRTAERLMAIARNPCLTKSNNLSLLPPSLGLFYLLSQVDVDRCVSTGWNTASSPDWLRAQRPCLEGQATGRERVAAVEATVQLKRHTKLSCKATLPAKQAAGACLGGQSVLRLSLLGWLRGTLPVRAPLSAAPAERTEPHHA